MGRAPKCFVLGTEVIMAYPRDPPCNGRVPPMARND